MPSSGVQWSVFALQPCGMRAEDDGPKKPDQPSQYTNSRKYQGSTREEMGPDPAAGLKPPPEQDPSIARTWMWATPHRVGGSFMYYHKVYHGELGISMPRSLGSPYQALQVTVLPCEHLHPGTGTPVPEPSPAPRTLPALRLSLWSVLESGFGGDAIWGRKVPSL